MKKATIEKIENVDVDTCSWGLGVTFFDDGEVRFGFSGTDDPKKFFPQPDVCTKKELENYKKALETVHYGPKKGDENITKADYEYWVKLDEENRKRREENTIDWSEYLDTYE